MTPRVGIVGGGMLGVVAAYRLAQRGAEVTLYERGPQLGGLAAAFDFEGHTIDRFYHVILPSDARMIATIEELGLGDQLAFAPSGVGVLIDGELRPFNGLGDFLRFSALSPWERLRLGGFVAYCQVRGRPDQLDDVPLERWLRRRAGRGVARRFFQPLLDSRFEGRHAELPATYLWARTRRLSSARSGRGGGEQMGALHGGHQTLVDAMAAAARASGATLRTGTAIDGVEVEDGRVVGVRVGGELERHDLTLVTAQPPLLGRLLPQELHGLLDAFPQRWLGVSCLILKLRRSLTPYYAVNICEPTPITTIVETSHIVGTDHTDGLRLLYVPRYCDPDAPDQTEAPESVYARYTEMIRRIVPSFDPDADVAAWTLQRARYVEPVHPLGAGARIPPVFGAVEGLALASNAQIYPWLLNGESVMGMADDVAAQAAERLGLQTA